MAIHMPKRVLAAFDVARITGWAAGGFTDPYPEVGHWRLAGKDPGDVLGRRIAELEDHLVAFFNLWAVTDAVMAMPVMSRNLNEANSNFALYGAVRNECWRRKVTLWVTPESTVRLEILGKGSGKTDEMKERVERWADLQGYDLADHNEADALLLWRWTRDEMARRAYAEARGLPYVPPAPPRRGRPPKKKARVPPSPLGPLGDAAGGSAT